MIPWYEVLVRQKMVCIWACWVAVDLVLMALAWLNVVPWGPVNLIIAVGNGVYAMVGMVIWLRRLGRDETIYYPADHGLAAPDDRGSGATN